MANNNVLKAEVPRKWTNPFLTSILIEHCGATLYHNSTQKLASCSLTNVNAEFLENAYTGISYIYM